MRHQVVHDEEENGPPSDMNDGIYIVSLKGPLPLQQMAERVLQIGKSETPYEFPLFTVGERSTNEPIAAIQILTCRAIAGVLTRIRSCEQRVQLANFVHSSFDGLWRPACGEAIESHLRRATEFIWVHKRHRGRGVLGGCLAKLAEHMGLPISEFSHSLPFTGAAVRFWRKGSLDSIYVAQSGWSHGNTQDDGAEPILEILKGNA